MSRVQSKPQAASPYHHRYSLDRSFDRTSKKLLLDLTFVVEWVVSRAGFHDFPTLNLCDYQAFKGIPSHFIQTRAFECCRNIKLQVPAGAQKTTSVRRFPLNRRGRWPELHSQKLKTKATMVGRKPWHHRRHMIGYHIEDAHVL